MNHPYASDLEKNKDAVRVSFSDLKNNPEQYDEKTIHTEGYVSSFVSKKSNYALVTGRNEQTISYYISNGNFISGDYKYDQNIYVSSDSNAPFLNCIIDESEYIEEGIQVGDCVEIVAEIRTFGEKRGTLFGKVIYKK